MNIGDKITFPENNRIRFFMDHRIWEGIPHDVDFFVEKDDGDCFWLWGDGFGGGLDGRPGSYGNGSIYVSKKMIINPPTGEKSEG
jgi:hypothetical protein